MKPHYPLHPLCSIFPEMPDAEFDALRDDIEQHGQRDAIVLWDGQILDGRHRMQACLALGIEPKFRTVEMSWEEAKAYVLSVNLTRRHLDASQRAIVASRMATLKKGRPSTEDNASIDALSVTQQEAADALNVGRAQVQRAKKVEQIAAPELFAEVERGKMSLHEAGKFATVVPDKAEQAEIVKAGRVKEVLKKALPPEEPPPLPKTNTLHSPATQQRIDRGPDPAPAQAVQDTHESPMLEVVIAQHGTTVEDAYGMPLLEVVIAQHTTREVIDALIVGLEGTQAKRVAEILREAADKLDPQPVVVHHEPASKPARPGKHPSADQLMDVARTYVTAWSGQLMTQVCAWAEYKQSLTGNAKVRSLASWETMLTRIDNVQKMRGAGTVCEMISKAIANGWQGWEHETNGGRGGSRISTAVRSNRNWDEEIPEWKPTE